MVKKKKNPNFKIILIIALVCIGLGLFFYYQFKQAQRVKNLKSMEVKEYQGENLSSVTDFRENSIKGPQHIDIKNYQLKISGLVNKPTSFTYDQVISGFQSYKKVVTLDCMEGWSATILWQGILVRDLLKNTQIKPEANTVIFRAYDGYSTSFPLDYILNNDIIVAYKMNDIPLPPERGFPFQLVAEDKWGYKWIKWITEIELSADENYKGYWESRGYSDSGDLNKDFIQ